MAFPQFNPGGGAAGHRPGESGYQRGYGSQIAATPQNNQQTPQALPTRPVNTRIAGATELSVDATSGQRGLANKGAIP